jgi:hypothetical protein
LPPVRPMTGQAADLRVLTEYRDQLVNERTATANRVHTDLLWLRPGYEHQLPHLTHMECEATNRLAAPQQWPPRQFRHGGRPGIVC